MLEVKQQVTVLSWREMPKNTVCKFYRVENVGKFLEEWKGDPLTVVYYNASTKTLYVPFSTVAQVEVFEIL